MALIVGRIHVGEPPTWIAAALAALSASGKLVAGDHA